MERCECGNIIDTGGFNGQCSQCRITQNQNTERNPKATEVEPEQVKSLLGEVPQCEAERYWFKNILFQRLHKDSLWYAIHNNQIIDWDRYRHDLEERLRDFA